MSKKLILIAGMAIALAGCGDKSDTATGEEGSMMDKAMDATKEMASDTADAVKGTTSNVVDGAGDMASDAADAVTDTTGNMVDGASDMASDAVDAAKDAVHDTAQGIADATADEAEAAAQDAASGAMDDAGKMMNQ